MYIVLLYRVFVLHYVVDFDTTTQQPIEGGVAVTEQSVFGWRKWARQNEPPYLYKMFRGIMAAVDGSSLVILIGLLGLCLIALQGRVPVALDSPQALRQQIVRDLSEEGFAIEERAVNLGRSTVLWQLNRFCIARLAVREQAGRFQVSKILNGIPDQPQPEVYTAESVRQVFGQRCYDFTPETIQPLIESATR
jgi:hypothetical protein